MSTFSPSPATASDKLRESGISSWVAEARGYSVIPQCATESAAGKAARDLGADLRSAQGKRIRQSLLDGDILVMPWYTVGDPGRVAATQLRPSVPGLDAKGKPVKYEFLQGARTPLGQHPAMPVAWLADTTIPVMLVEGMLKADSALTALLDAWGARSCDDLPDEARVAIISFAAVGNWGDNPEWAGVALDGRAVWIGFDADVRTKPGVHAMAVRLWEFLTRRGATPSLIDLSAVTTAKGIDDFFGAGGDWKTLLSSRVDVLPPLAMDRDADRDAGFRISPQGTALEKWVESKDASGAVVSASWMPSWTSPWGLQSFPLGGRVVSITTTRSPSETENRTGAFGSGVDAEDAMASRTVEILVSWADPDTGETSSATITGDSALLNVAPDRWSTIASLRVKIPDEVLLRPCWPPAPSLGLAWLKAVKAASPDVETRTAWMRDGWVPQEKDPVPCFLIGPQTIGDSDGRTLSASRSTLQRWESYGVGPTDPRAIDDPAYLADVGRDLRAVLETFSNAFTSPGTFASVIFAMLRPCVPLRPRTPVYIEGGSGGGKTYTASAIMGGWSSEPGVFQKESLPGSAQDSIPFTESVLTSAVIHVADDLAPSSSDKKAQAEQETIEALLRNVFNGTGRGRSNPDGTVRQARVPRALLIATAENSLFVESIKNRVLTIHMNKGALPKDREPTDRLDWLCNVDGAPARVVQAALKLLRRLASTGFADPNPDDVADASDQPQRVESGWATMVDWFKIRRDAWGDFVTSMLEQRGFPSADTTRAADMLSDILLSADVLGLLLDAVGADPRTWGLGNPAAWVFEPANATRHPGDDEYSARAYLTRNMARQALLSIVPSQVERSRMTPGKAFLLAVKSLLASGEAHLVCRGDVNRFPGRDEEDAVRFGWGTDGETMRPRGRNIGSWGLTPDGVEVVCLSLRSAFGLAQRLQKDLVPSGTGQAQISTAIRSEGLLYKNSVFGDDSSSSFGRATVGKMTTQGAIVPVLVLFADEAALDAEADADQPGSEADRAEE